MKMLRGVDLFCGAGGSTTGAEASGRVKVVYAVNHWQTAIQTHRQNHPETHHVCARIDQIDPQREVPDFDLLMASPECTHHSNARGGRPVEDQKRATGWDVVRWCEHKRPKWFVVENVREWLKWGPIGKNGRPIKSKIGETFLAWVAALRSLGYHVEWKLLNAADYGDATKRIRLFIIGRRGGRGPIPWPVPTHAKADWTPAWKVIDWSKNCPSIFDRKRPLADKTIRRIMIGLKKFCGPAAEPFIIKMRGTGTANSVQEPVPTMTGGGTHLGVATPFQYQLIGRGAGRAKGVDQPLPSIVAARENHGVVIPFLCEFHGGKKPGRNGDERQRGLFEPLPTITTEPRFALATPFLVDRNWQENREGRNRVHDIQDPLTTITGQPGQCLAVPFFLQRQGFYRASEDHPPVSIDEPIPTITANHAPGHVVVPFLADVNHGESGGSRTNPVTEPLGTITAKRGKSVVLPFLTSYFSNGKPQSVQEPISTLTAKGRHGLALVELMEELGIVDIGFRMLDEDELARAQGFPEGYSFHGTKADVIRMIGNAVCPGVMKAICSAIAGA